MMWLICVNLLLQMETTYFFHRSIPFKFIDKDELLILFIFGFMVFQDYFTHFDLFVLRLNVPVNNFSVMSGRSHRFLGN